MTKLFMVVNEDRFFLSHRKPIAIAAKDKGYDVTIVAKDTGSRDEIEKLGLKFIPLTINPTSMNPIQEFRTFFSLTMLYWREKPDIVHHVGLKNILWGGLVARLLRINGVVNAVSGLGSLFNGNKLYFVSKCVMRIMRFSNYRKRVKVIFQNNDDKKIFIDNHVIKPEQVEFTKGSGIDLNEFHQINEPDDENINIIFTARMVKEKGICDLIEAAERLKPLFGNKSRYWLCGRLTPNKTGVTEEYMRSHCDNEYICWLGERKDIQKLLEKSHIMAFPSYYREGVPKSLIEASAIGRPIITCNSIGCKDVVTDGENGFLIEPKNIDQLVESLKRLISNKSLRIRMGQSARKHAENEFDINTVINTHLKIYHELS